MSRACGGLDIQQREKIAPRQSDSATLDLPQRRPQQVRAESWRRAHTLSLLTTVVTMNEREYGMREMGPNKLFAFLVMCVCVIVCV